MKIRVGTRGSRLALTQTNMVIDTLKKHHPEIDVEVVVIKTKGDKILNISLDKIGDKGLFVKEIEDQLLNGNIDMAIHSMKDMPGEASENLILLPVLNREDPRDVLVTRHKISTISELPAKARIATGSKRRSSQLEALLPDVIIEPIRGNVETRIKKMIDQNLDGTVLASAGINRLGLTSNEHYRIIPFEVDEMIPAPSQGVLALQMVESNKIIFDLVQSIIDENTQLEATVERAFLKTLHGGCHLPMGAYLDLDKMIFHGIFGDEGCHKVIGKSIPVTRENAEAEAIKLANILIKEVTS